MSLSGYISTVMFPLGASIGVHREGDVMGLFSLLVFFFVSN